MEGMAKISSKDGGHGYSVWQISLKCGRKQASFAQGAFLSQL